MKKIPTSTRAIGLTVTICLVAVIGVVLLRASRAATPFVSAEAENGAVSAPATSASDSSASGGSYIKFASGVTPPSGSIKTVFIMMMENTDWSGIKGNGSYPYLNSLLPRYAHAENYRSNAGHPSLPNYVSLEAGDTLGMTDGAWLPSDHPLSQTDHLSTLLNAKGVDWHYYAESLPGNGSTCNTSDPGTPYSLDHNSFVYFNDVRNNTSYCIQHERPYSELASKLSAGTVSGYNFIVPNDWDQGEKPAPGSNCQACQADNFMKAQIPMIQSSNAYKNGGLILILWDEGSGTSGSSPNPIGLVAVSQYSKVGYSNNISYTHGSTVRSVEKIFGVSPFLRTAANSTDLSDLLTVPL